MNKRKALSILLTLALILGFIPGMRLKAQAETTSESREENIGALTELTQAAEGTYLRHKHINGYIYDACFRIKALANGIKDPETAEYTVEFVDGLGNIIDTQKVRSGMNAEPPSDPERDGYSFDGWDRDYTNITGNKIITALWTSTRPLMVAGADIVNDPDHSISTETQGVTNGTASYDPERNKLTLDGFVYSGKGYVTEPITAPDLSGSEIASGIHYEGREPLTIEIKNDSSITQTGNDAGDTYGIYSHNDLIIEGDGSLTVTAGETSVDSAALCCDADISITGGTLTVTGGEALEDEGDSYGISCNGIISITGCTVKSEGKTAGNNSCGIYGNNGISITDSIVTASGDMAYYDSNGIFGSNDFVTITDSTVTAESGTAGLHGYGITGNNGVIIKGGSVDALGGTMAYEYGYSSGISGYINGVSIADGAEITAAGGKADNFSYGIFVYNDGSNNDELYIGENVKSLTASGYTKAMEGFVTNKISGKGWTDIDGTKGEKLISAGDDQELDDIKYVVFPENFIPVKSVKLNKDELNLTVGGTQQLKATVEPDNAADKNLIWKSSNTDIATVDENGSVKAVSAGNAVITVTAGSGRTAECSVTVTRKSSGGGGGGGSGLVPSNPSNPVQPSDPVDPANPVQPSDPVDPVQPLDPADVSFTDVSEDAYFADAVKWAVEKGITKGTTDTTFSPYDSCTRAQMVTFLWRAAGSPEPQSTDNPFTDVDTGLYYGKAVQWAVEKGITKGTTDTTFSPDDTVNRAQTITFIYRAAGSPEVANKEAASQFTDLDPESYYMNAVNWAWSNNLTNGTGADTFCPGDDCTRAQIVTLLYRYYGA